MHVACMVHIMHLKFHACFMHGYMGYMSHTCCMHKINDAYFFQTCMFYTYTHSIVALVKGSVLCKSILPYCDIISWWVLIEANLGVGGHDVGPSIARLQ